MKCTSREDSEMLTIFSFLMFRVVTKHVIVHFVKVPLGVHLALLRFSVLMFYVIKKKTMYLKKFMENRKYERHRGEQITGKLTVKN